MCETSEAQYSLPFPVAALLVRGLVGPAEIDGTALVDPELLRRILDPLSGERCGPTIVFSNRSEWRLGCERDRRPLARD